MEKSELVASLSREIKALVDTGVRPVIVHGGGPSINQELTARGISWEFIDGQRVTTPAMIDVIEMVLSGKVNRRIVRALNHAGVSAVGLSGTDAKMLECRQASEKLGQVGLVERVHPQTITHLWSAGLTPVIAPLGCDSTGGVAFNVNADWAACRIAQSLQAQSLLFLTDQDGILGEDGKLIRELDRSGLESLIGKEIVQGGMLTKAQTILHALGNGIKSIRVMNAASPQAILKQDTGTLCHA